MPSTLTFTFPNVSRAALRILRKQLRDHGATVTPTRVISEAGEMTYIHHVATRTLTICVINHTFHHRMLVGGMRQMVEEAIEKVKGL